MMRGDVSPDGTVVAPSHRSDVARGKVEPARGRINMGVLVIVVLVLLLIGALPTWPYSSGWGYYPSGGLGLVLLILLILALTGRL
jgi:hypothetical protein